MQIIPQVYETRQISAQKEAKQREKAVAKIDWQYDYWFILGVIPEQTSGLIVGNNYRRGVYMDALINKLDAQIMLYNKCGRSATSPRITNTRLAKFFKAKEEKKQITLTLFYSL